MRIRRRGRHTTPSQVEKVAQQAGKAAPAFAIAGALVAVPSASQAFAAAKPATATVPGQATAAADKVAGADTNAAKATVDSVETHAVTVAATQPARHAATATSTRYSVRTGDTLSKIANSFYHNAGDWQYLYHQNEKTVANPDLIYAGQQLVIPATAPAHYTLSDYVPKHAKAAAPVISEVSQTSEVRGSSKLNAAASPYFFLAQDSLRKYEPAEATIIITRITKIHTSSWTWTRGFGTASTMNEISATPVTP